MRVALWVGAVMVATYPLGGVGQLPSADPCDSPATTIEMRMCAEARLKSAEKELEQICSAMLARLPDEAHKKSFLASQEAWRTYRDAEVDFEGHFYDGGTIQRQVKLNGRTRMTQARVAELRQRLKDEVDH